MNKYIFLNTVFSRIKVDPIFEHKEYHLYTRPDRIDPHYPQLFEITIGYRTFRYCLVDPIKALENQLFVTKMKRYILVHCDELTDPFENVTFFIGDMEKCIEVSFSFTNQNIQLVTYEMINQWYPKTIEEIHKIICKKILKSQKFIGERHNFLSMDEDFLFVDKRLSESEKRDYKFYLFDSMVSEGLITKINTGMIIDCFVLSPKGIEVANDKHNKSKLAFIATRFADENSERIKAIHKAITECGFEPCIMNRVETNNWIMPEIFNKIDNSRFVVVDFSLHCDGAYYEAGYAAGVQKPVIHLFDKREESESNKLHFDIAQKSTILYKNFADLKERLVNRIKATIK